MLVVTNGDHHATQNLILVQEFDVMVLYDFGCGCSCHFPNAEKSMEENQVHSSQCLPIEDRGLDMCSVQYVHPNRFPDVSLSRQVTPPPPKELFDKEGVGRICYISQLVEKGNSCNMNSNRSWGITLGIKECNVCGQYLHG